MTDREPCHDWASFYARLGEHGWRALAGLDEADGELIAAVGSASDAFWSDSLEAALEQGAVEGDLRGGVLAALEVWRSTVLSVLAGEYGISLDRRTIVVEVDSPEVDRLVASATPLAG